MVTVIRTVKQG